MEHFNAIEANMAQMKYCKKNNLPHFAPEQYCWKCNQDIYGEKGKTVRSMSHKWINGISVEKAESTFITGCPFCSWSYCD
mgnify:FL=1